MSSVGRDVRGRFINALQELVPALGVQPLQIAAAEHPERSAKGLAKPLPKRRGKRHINHHLAGKAH